MPCDDVTERIELSLSADDRLSGYRLTKRSCGAEVGPPSLLATWLAGWSLEDILTLDGATLAEHCGPHVERDAFLYAKHLIALQRAIEVLIGRAPGAPDSDCAAASIAADANGTHFVGTLAVHLLVERIEACGRACCGQPRQPDFARTSG